MLPQSAVSRTLTSLPLQGTYPSLSALQGTCSPTRQLGGPRPPAYLPLCSVPVDANPFAGYLFTRKETWPPRAAPSKGTAPAARCVSICHGNSHSGRRGWRYTPYHYVHWDTSCSLGAEALKFMRKSRRRRAYPQQIVTTRLLYCLQDPFAHLSRLQRI